MQFAFEEFAFEEHLSKQYLELYTTLNGDRPSVHLSKV